MMFEFIFFVVSIIAGAIASISGFGIGMPPLMLTPKVIRTLTKVTK